MAIDIFGQKTLYQPQKVYKNYADTTPILEEVSVLCLRLYFCLSTALLYLLYGGFSTRLANKQVNHLAIVVHIHCSHHAIHFIFRRIITQSS